MAHAFASFDGDQAQELLNYAQVQAAECVSLRDELTALRAESTEFAVRLEQWVPAQAGARDAALAQQIQDSFTANNAWISEQVQLLLQSRLGEQGSIWENVINQASGAVGRNFEGVIAENPH